jgi:hypothetical protein
MRIRASSVFERVVYHCWCVDDADPGRPVLEVEALLHDGDADGPLLVTVADYKRMAGFETAETYLPTLRAGGRTTSHDGVEYLTFPVWRPIDDE